MLDRRPAAEDYLLAHTGTLALRHTQFTKKYTLLIIIICLLHYNSNTYKIKHETKFHTVGPIAISNTNCKLHFIRIPILPKNVGRS